MMSILRTVRVCTRCSINHTRQRRVNCQSVTKGVFPLRCLSTGRKLASQISSRGEDKRSLFRPLDTFARRHNGPSGSTIEPMLAALDPPAKTLDEFVSSVIPKQILSTKTLRIEASEQRSQTGEPTVPVHQEGATESQLLARLSEIALGNNVARTYIGCGYAGTRVPEVIKRNVLEDPGWYTAYTPYQAEISQGRLESLLNYQTIVSELTGLSISNASLLDEATAAAEAMTISVNAVSSTKLKRDSKVYFVSNLVHPQTIAVLESRAHGFGIQLVIGDALSNDCQAVKDCGEDLVGVLVQYPDTEGGIEDFTRLSDLVHGLGGTMNVATDLLALTLLKPPGEFGADVAFGNAQRFGVPFGYGGPHAAFIAINDKQKRKIPGRLVGVSKDRLGDPAVRLALQTREQHIRRERATSNICTAQVLLAHMSAFYAIYHGPQGLVDIASKVMASTMVLERCLCEMGYTVGNNGGSSLSKPYFDTIVVNLGKGKTHEVMSWAVKEKNINLRCLDDSRIGITVDETVEERDLQDLLDIFAQFVPSSNRPQHSSLKVELDRMNSLSHSDLQIPETLRRDTPFLTHPVFNSYHSETELLRYISHLRSKDLSLTHSMIPLGSCTMKLNATTEMVPVTWPSFSSIHPFVPVDQAQGYRELITELEADLAEITGFDKVSLQPNSGAQGEFTALRVIRKFLEQQGGRKRDICLIPVSAHGTNPASAVMAGMRVVSIKCDTKTGNLDMGDLRQKCEKHASELGAIMVTYPSTFGVFEPGIKEACDLVHSYGGQVYMDGANLNAQIGLCSPAEIGADACHLNLHKTFCIPHGGGGPGVGPIGVASHLSPYLPGHPLVSNVGGKDAIAAVSAAPWGSASILPISWAYIKMMGAKGLTQATKLCLLNANYILSRLKPHYPILYTNESGRCAHEFILDIRPFKDSAGIEAADVAKRLQDYGFHAPTMSWPVANTLMIEPTESESKPELDRFCEALISIRQEIKEVEEGRQPREGNVLKMAPHPQQDLVKTEWDRPYSRERAAYPLEWLRRKKFWPSVARIDDAYGDTNLFCSCSYPESNPDVTGKDAPMPT